MSATNRRKIDNKNDECSQRIRSYKNTRHGTPEGTRTPDLLIRSQSLYPTELLAHTHFFQMPEYNTTSLRKKQVLFSLFPTFLSSPPRRLDSAGACGVKCSPEGDTGYG